MANNKSRIRRRRKRSILRKIILLISLIVLLVVGYGAYVAFQGYQASKKTFNELERGNQSELRGEAVKISEDPFSILLMGVEDYSTGGDHGRTDTLILLTIDPKKKTAKMVSIPRDTRVEIVGRGKMDKINHAHAFGGPDMTIDTIENFLDIPIDYYAKVNFQGFKDIINEINGVEVDVPFDFWEYSDEVNRKKIQFTEGPMKLDGEEALAYVRMRRFDSDFGRSDRQRQVIDAALDKTLSVSGLFKLDDIADHLGENIQTNLTALDLVSLKKNFADLNSANIENLKFNGEDARINGIYYFEPYEDNVNEIEQILKNHLNHENTSEE
ncbi:LCP family protein [Guptibacillus algicola]|uniref:LCP family protein n=1 Tax=Guptibacillus algicola TaxID=225844 RepID=UPI001CD44009|nr:LCP family protein [Alkalihalobacillus algicola]MCA0986861.1 LCP family protein [Alkalihalobacillus algicola]